MERNFIDFRYKGVYNLSCLSLVSLTYQLMMRQKDYRIEATFLIDAASMHSKDHR